MFWQLARPNRLLLYASNEGDYWVRLIPLILVARQVLKIHPNPKKFVISSRGGGSNESQGENESRVKIGWGWKLGEGENRVRVKIGWGWKYGKGENRMRVKIGWGWKYCEVKFRYFTFILLLVICKILSFLATWIPLSFSTELYDIQSCSRVSPTASNPVKFFILFRAKFKITKFFSPFKFAILSIAFVHRFNFLQFTSTNNLKNICQ